ncbi:ribonuclease R [Adlercreutzia sp. ZJ304]|uniref:ribonuclease R n=1 Tax=Adlercreutzia sp. ZJ304 TaxID=2709791 RepID=UPI0013E9A61D|nr:ribonuclease R [Adlercreutzia sp. ZJ304]
MGRKKRSPRRKPKANPRGIIEINRAGYGFVRTAEGDFFIPRSCVGDAFDGDLVEVARKTSKRAASYNSRQRPEARVVRALERAHTTLIGIYEIAEPFGIVIPDDKRIQHDIFTRLEDMPGIPDGSLVRVAIDIYPSKRSAAMGHVIEVLGCADDALLSSTRIIARNDIRTVFSKKAIDQAESCKVDAELAFREGYRDIRNRFVFTIDPADAKDFDDAISIEKIDSYEGRPCKWRLGVHIADVAYYVDYASSIDEEAQKRAVSVYLADRVVPMLPEALSNDICSLRPDEDRRCMSVDIYIDENATMVGYDIYSAVMKSNARLTYAQALDMLQGNTSSNKDLEWRLREASLIAKTRERARYASGGIEFATKEAKIILDDDGHAIGIDIRQKDDSTTLIEEAMIFANEVVAMALQNSNLACAYRIHEPPHVDALEGVVKVLREFKWFDKNCAERLVCGEPFAIQQVLEKAKGRPEAELVTSLLLRAMTRAVYSTDNVGHYGLGLKTYCHFTSPIRRYPDLMVHRLLKAMLARDSRPVRKMIDKLPQLCEHCSGAERVAENAERQSREIKIAEYLQDFIGRRFSAVISGVATYGVYVRLDCTAEGLIPIRELGSEYFVFEAASYMLRGSDTGRIFRLGQALDVVLVQADVQAPALTFRPASKKRKEKRPFTTKSS